MKKTSKQTRKPDFRKSFDGLAAIVEQLNMEITEGDVFIFLNKRANQIRLLFWERDGLCLVCKRLEMGTFRRVNGKQTENSHIEIDAAQLVLLLEGIDVGSMSKRKRYIHTKKGQENLEKSAA